MSRGTLFLHIRMFQVEVIYQRCTANATCNCAVAVKSGDTVLVIDRCSREPQKPTHVDEQSEIGQNNSSCDQWGCNNVMKTSVFAWNRITPGTRVFRKSDGKMFDVSYQLDLSKLCTINTMIVATGLVVNDYDQSVLTMHHKWLMPGCMAS